MSERDEFDLRQLIGDVEDVEASVPEIADVPASELSILPVMADEPKAAKFESHPISPRVEHVGAPVPPRDEKLSHPIPLVPMSVEVVDTPPTIAPLLKDEAGDLDDEYYQTFNATVAEVQTLEPEALQTLRHRLDRIIRRAKIQQKAIRITEEGKLALITESRRRKIREKDTEFMAKRKVAQGDATTGTSSKSSSSKSSGGMTQLEKQVKQFVKLNMSEAVIRATLQSLGTTAPENLAEMIAKFKK